MAEVTDHIISNPSDTQTGGFGRRYPANYISAYAGSPIYDGTITDEGVIQTFVSAVQEGDATSSFNAYGVNVPGGVGNRMSSYDRDYPDAPDVAANTTTADGEIFGAGRGAPTNAYIPPLTSPGPGSVSATDQPAYTGHVPDPALNVEFGSGLGGLANPSETSPEIASQDTATALISGASYEGSG